jgi:hypothetical protein
LAVVVFALAAVGCSGNAKLTELQRVRSGALDVVLLTPGDGLKHGRDVFVIEFRSPEGTLVDVGQVRGSATMPMPSMPMFGSMAIKQSEVPGRYTVDGQFEMAGTWRMTIEWQRPAKGSVTLSANVQ